MKRKKIAIIIPCWKRADIAAMAIRQLDVFYQETKSKIDLIVIYIFSKSDPELRQLHNYYKDANHPRDYVYSANNRLGQKINDGISYAGQYNYDYIMNFGSDDLIHPNLIDLYLPLIKRSIMIFGINRVYFYKEGEDSIFFSYYNTPFVVGAGRMIHRQVIDTVVQLHTGLYEPTINRGMDTMSAKRMEKCGFKQTVVDPGNFPMIVDIKSDININSFQQLLYSHNVTNRLQRCSSDLIIKEFNLLNTP